MSVNKELHLIFVDAQRRICLAMRNGRTDISKMWVGLGSATAYRTAVKAGLMVPLNGKINPRVSNWFLFTPDGVKAFASWSFDQWSATYGDSWGAAA